MKTKYVARLGLLMALVAGLIAALASGCNSNSNSNSSTDNSTGTCSNCSTITPENFVAALVSLAQSGQIPAAYGSSTLTKAATLQPGYFVIWDGQTHSYEAVEIAAACSAGSGVSCSNENAQAAAQAFAGAGAVNHYQAGSNDVVNGTQFEAPFGSGTQSGIGAVEAGLLNYFPVSATTTTDPQGDQLYQDGFSDGLLYSVGTQTKDVDLQAAQVQNASLLQRAAQLSTGLQMDFKSAIQLTQLADRIQTLQSTQNQLTSADRGAITQNLLTIAGVSQDEVDQAVAGGIQGDMTQASALMDKVSQNLGMPTATLRDQILPKLGVSLN